MNLDLLEKVREKVRVHMAAYQLHVACYYNSRVKEKHLQSGDLMLERAKVSQPTERGKLSPN